MNNKIHFIGRHIKKDNKEYFAYSGCGFEFTLKPSKDEFSFSLKLISELREHDAQYLNIYVNDELYSQDKLVEGSHTIKVSLKSSKTTFIRVIKINEVYLSSLYLEDIVLENAEFIDIKPSNKKHIGFFGDSVTCGYGLLDLHGNEFKMETEDFTKTYAYLACFALNLEYSVVARSGISMAITIWCDKLFEEIYDTVDMYEKCPVEHKLDYAVINLGANDNSGYGQSQDRDAALKTFKERYIHFVDRLIKDNPNVKLVICYKILPLVDEITNTIKEVYKEVISRYSNKIVLLEFITNQDGANFHPYLTAHKENANRLVDVIKKLEN